MTEQGIMAATINETEESLVFLYTSNLQQGRRQDIPRNVTHIRIQEDVQILPLWTLSKLTRLEQVEFPQNGAFQILGRHVLMGCISLQVLNLPPSTLEIRAGALAGCFQLGSVHLNPGLVKILDSAFQHCRSLTNVSIPPSVKTLGNLVFHGCHSLCQVELPPGLQILGRSVFVQCNSLMQIYLPSSIVYIGSYCFKDCFRLQSVELAPTSPLKVVIRAEAFRNCPNLRNICISAETFLEGGYDNVFDTDTLLLTKQDDDIPDLDLDVDAEFLEHHHDSSTTKPTKTQISMQNRYSKLPIHRLCYYQAHWLSMKESEGGAKSIVEEMKELLIKTRHDDTIHQQQQKQQQQQDYMCMTPLHILALSTKPNWELWKLVHQAFPDHLFVKDKWGREPLQYLLDSSIEDNHAMETILKHAIRERLHHRLAFLGGPWRSDFVDWIDTLPMDTKTSRRSSANRILERRCRYERMEALSLLDSAVWKVEWQRMLTMLKDNETTEETSLEESMAIKRSHDLEDWKEARETCRVQCRSEVVVSNVMQFLDPVFKFYLNDPVALF